MPSLKKSGNLEYNPNSIFSASKKLATISLQNMENTALNPDVASKINSGLASTKIGSDSAEFLSGLEQLKILFKTAFTYQEEGRRLFLEELGDGDIKTGEDRVINDDNLRDKYYHLLTTETTRPLKLPNYGIPVPSDTIERQNYQVSDGKYRKYPHEEQPYFEEMGSGIKRGGSGRGRPKGSKNKSPTKSQTVPSSSQKTIPSLWNATSNEEDMEAEQLEGDLQGAVEPPRFTPKLSDTVTGQPTSTAVGSVYQDSSDEEAEEVLQETGSDALFNLYKGDAGDGDDGGSSSSDEDTIASSVPSHRSRRSYMSEGSRYSVRGVPSEVGDGDPDNDDSFSGFSGDSSSRTIRHPTEKKQPLALALLKASSQIERINVFFNGKIRKNINYLDRLTVQNMVVKMAETNNIFNALNQEYIEHHIENGEMIYNDVRSRLHKLEVDLLIGVKSYVPQASSGGSIMGGNFASGSPSIGIVSFNRNLKNNPTKYLL